MAVRPAGKKGEMQFPSLSLASDYEIRKFLSKES
jgi:hypothetical protein